MKNDNLLNHDDADMEMVPRSVTFDIKCASYDSKEFTLLDNSSCNLQFQLEHTLGCGSSASNSKFIYYFRT